jgi:aspartokinase/homoserine dehydrogenase 1
VTHWTVHKFGGTSLADAGRYTRAADLVRASGDGPVAVVVSAPAGITDSFLEAVALAARRDPSYRQALYDIRDRIVGLARELLEEDAGPLIEVVESDARDLEDVLRGVELTRTAPEQTAELVSGFGEVWSAQMLRAHFVATGTADADWLDAREVLIVKRTDTGPLVQWEKTRERLAAWSRTHPAQTVVVTGYVASDEAGVATSLQRNGSDYTASIFGRLLDASSITIWTDVEGVMSADPRLVPEAVLLPYLSYDEAAELAYFGARVLHPHTMAPAIAADIPVKIRDAGHPDGTGTLLASSPPTELADERVTAVKGFSSSADVALLNIEGLGLMGVPGIAQRLFGALRDVGVSVAMISQAGSEHSICAAIPIGQAELARSAVEHAFHAELHYGQVQTIDVDGPYRILAAVGDRMEQTPGVAARFFGALGSANINVRAIAQGSSERNISAVVDARDSARALRAVHSGFYLSDRTLSIGLLGPGRIGSELLRQIAAGARTLHERFQIDLRVRGIMRSSTMVLDERGIDLERWKDLMTSAGEPADLDRFLAHVDADHIPHAVVVDCTASAAFNDLYPAWLDAGVHVVTANKHATSAGLDLFRRIREPRRLRRAHYLGSATVGAGLPVVRTLQDLVRTGDRVHRIEGVLSGTLSYLFNGLSAGTPFSAMVAEAFRRGYTEPDPREDLTGMDVVRKALILGREMGLALEPSDVSVQSLVPEMLQTEDTTPEAFLEKLADHDGEIEARRESAAEEGSVLRYVASIEEAGAAVGLRTFPSHHPFANVTGADAIVAFATERYDPQPLIIQGPGAGPEVTAGGVFADLLRLAGLLGGSTPSV